MYYLFHLIYFYFYTAVDSNGQKKWEGMLKVVGNGSPDDPMIPRVFKVFAGNLTTREIILFNAMLVDWQLNMKKKRIKVGESAWFCLSTHIKTYVSFWRGLKENYHFESNIEDFQEFQGSVWQVIHQTIARRER